MPIEPGTDIRESDERQTPRPHTGRRRNPAAHQAILDAAAALVSEPGDQPLTIETIAARAGVGKQTIYRWWPTKYAVLLEVFTQRANADVSAPDTGNLYEDLTEFLATTFVGAAAEPTASLLRIMVAKAQTDADAADMMREFTSKRRGALREVLARGLPRGELSSGADLDLLVDQAYGVLWYRLLIGHVPLTEGLATQLATALIAQASGATDPPRR